MVRIKMNTDLYPLSDRVRMLLENIPDSKSLYHFIYKLNNYNFITNLDVEDILIEMCKSLGFDITKNTQLTVYKSDNKSYVTFYSLKHPIIRKKILYHYKSLYYNKAKLKNKGLRLLNNREIRLEHYYNIMKDDNVAIREFPNTEIIAMDIDTHNYFTKSKTSLKDRRKAFEELCKEIFSFIKTEIDCPLLFAETSKIHRGIHFYFKLENCHNKKIIEEQMKILLEKNFPNIKVEFRTRNHALRLPLSIDYVARDVNTFTKMKKLSKIILSFFKNFKDIKSSNQKIYEHLKSLNDADNIEIFADNKKCPFYRPSKITNSKNTNYIPPTERFKIYDGNRVGGDKTLWRLANWCIHNKKSEDEFISLAFECNVNSKDMSNPNKDKVRKDLSRIYNYAISRFKPLTNYIPIYKTNVFHSNLSLISNKHKKTIKSFAYKLKKILPDTHHKTRFLKEIEIASLEFLGKIEYEILCPRKIFSNAKISLKKRNELLKGYQFPLKYLKELKKYYSLKSDIRILFKMFRMYFLEPIVHSNGSTYIPILGSCNQYRINSFIQLRLGILNLPLSIQTVWDKKKSNLLWYKFTEEKHIIMLSSLGYNNTVFGSLKDNCKYFNKNLGILDDWLRKYTQKFLKSLKFLESLKSLKP